MTRAAVAQLTVPVIAAVGATLMLHESLGARFIACGGAVLLGVALVLSPRWTSGR